MPRLPSMTLVLAAWLAVGCGTGRPRRATTPSTPAPPRPVAPRAPLIPVRAVFEADANHLSRIHEAFDPPKSGRERDRVRSCLPDKIRTGRVRVVVAQRGKHSTVALILDGGVDAPRVLACIERDAREVAAPFDHVRVAGRPAALLTNTKESVFVLARDAKSIAFAPTPLAEALATDHPAVRSRGPRWARWAPGTVARWVLRDYRPPATRLGTIVDTKGWGPLRSAVITARAGKARWTIEARLTARSPDAAQRIVRAVRKPGGTSLPGLRASATATVVTLRAQLEAKRAQKLVWRASRLMLSSDKLETSPSYRDAIRIEKRSCGCWGKKNEYACYRAALRERNTVWVGLKRFTSLRDRRLAKAAIGRGDRCLRRLARKHMRRLLEDLRKRLRKRKLPSP